MRRTILRFTLLASTIAALSLASPHRPVVSEAAGPGMWTATSAAPAPGNSSNLILLPNGKTFQAGGFDTTPSQYNPATNTWTTLGLFEFRYQAAATLLRDGHVLVTGGSPSLPAYTADPSTGVTTPTNAVVAVRYAPGAVLLPNGKVLVVGGAATAVGSPMATAEIYDPATNTWAAAAPMADARVGPGVVLLGNGKVLVVGGVTDLAGTPVSSAELYDPALDSWSTTGVIATGLEGHSATLLPNGKVLAAGGFDGGIELATTQLYDPLTNAWTTVSSMITARRYVAATLLGSGLVLIAGGRAGGAPTASAETYDPATDAWTATGSLGVPRQGAQATLLSDGRVLIVNGNGAGYGELFDPARWRTVASPAIPRLYHTATLLWNGKVLVAGGGSANAELYDEKTNTWSSAGTMSAPRENHAATRLNDGRVLVVGGSDGPNTGLNHLLTAEIYNPSTNSWSAAAPPSLDHFGDNGVTLPDGRVFVYGGFSGPAEIFSPTSNTWAAPATNPYGHQPANAIVLSTGSVLTLDVPATANVFNVSTNDWTPTTFPGSFVPGLPTRLRSSNRIVVTGGVIFCTMARPNALADVLLFDPITQIWTTGTSMSDRRDSHTATGLYDGSLLVTGGSNRNGDCLSAQIFLASAERYDAGTNTWTQAGSMSGARSAHTATLLTSGNVLIVGGSDGVAVVPTSELYDIGTNTDSDSDGYNDGLEIALGQHPFLKCDVMRADINYDGVVNPGDQAKLTSVIGSRPAQARFDQVIDTVINVGDQAKMASKVGQKVLACP